MLIDTGYTRRATTAPNRSIWLRSYSSALRPKLIDHGQPSAVLGRFGLKPKDVAWVIVTHFHVDHVAGLDEFPNARFITSQSAWDALQSDSWLKSVRHGVFPELIPKDFGQRFDPIESMAQLPMEYLPGSADLFGDQSVMAVPLPGHAAGHFGILFPQTDPPVLYGTDTQWLIDGIQTEARPRLLPKLISADVVAGRKSSDDILRFQQSGGHVVLCHDDNPTPYDLSEGAVL